MSKSINELQEILITVIEKSVKRQELQEKFNPKLTRETSISKLKSQVDELRSKSTFKTRSASGTWEA